jgi:hypothetical protein
LGESELANHRAFDFSDYSFSAVLDRRKNCAIFTLNYTEVCGAIV